MISNKLVNNNKNIENKAKNSKKDMNIFVYFILATIVCLIIGFLLSIMNSSFFSDVLNGLIRDILTHGSYSERFIVELFLFIVLFLIARNYKIINISKLRKKKIGTMKAILMAWPLLFVSLLEFSTSLYEVIFLENNVNYRNILSLILWCLSVGLFEEFICRGIVQNKFIEKYGTSYRKILLCIFLSSLVFGFMHIVNYFNGKSLFETIMQTIQAIGAGFVLGAIYYRTKNLFSVIIIHALDDIMIFFSRLIFNHIQLSIPISTLYFQFVTFSLIQLIVFSIYAFKLLQKNNLDNDEICNDNLVIRRNKMYTITVILLLLIYYVLFLCRIFYYR